MRTDFQLLEAPKPVPDEVLDDARAFIARVRWTYASSVPEAPHAYLPRDHVPIELREDFDGFCAAIKANGYRGRFGGTVFVYLEVDGLRYWESRNVYGPGSNLNRSRPIEPDHLALDGVA